MRQRRIRNGYGCTVDFDDEETKFLARMIGGPGRNFSML